MALLPAGMRNNNPGNIKWVGQPGTTASVNTDQGDPQAVFATPEAGMAAMYNLLLRKYRGGKISPAMIIAGQGGWTPGNMQAAQNVANSIGIGVNDDIGLTDPAKAARFMRGLVRQEHGAASDAYSDAMINAAVSGTQAKVGDPAAATTSVSGVTPPTVVPGATQPNEITATPATAPVLQLGAPNDPFSSLAKTLADSVGLDGAGGGRSGVSRPSLSDGGADPSAPLPDFAKATPAPLAIPPPVDMSPLAELFKVTPDIGQAAALNTDSLGRPIRRRTYG
jgi:hypothetical protein